MARNDELDLQSTGTEDDDVLLPEGMEFWETKVVKGKRREVRTIINADGYSPAANVGLPDRAISKKQPSIKAELINQLKLDTQYVERLGTLRHFGFLGEAGKAREGEAKIPSFKEAMKAITTEELEIARGFQKPTLIIRPEISMRAKIRAIDANLPDNGRTMSGSEAVTQVNESLTDIDAGSETVTGWRSFIVDGAQEMEPYKGDPTHETFKDRISWGQAGFRLSESDIDPDTYLMLVMEAIKNGKPIDQNTYTIFPGYDPNLGSELAVPRVFLAKWSEYYKRLILSWDAPMHIDPRARMRRCVGGKDLIK
jgi:hypothetical protein